MCSFNHFCGVVLSVLWMAPSFSALRLSLVLACPYDCEGGVHKKSQRTEGAMGCVEGIEQSPPAT